MVHRFLFLITKKDFISNFGAIVFLLHPSQIESVGWISELKNLISTTFLFLAFIQYYFFIKEEKQKKYFLSLLFFVFACLCKSSVVILPLLFLVLDFFVLENIRFKFILNKIPFFLISILFGLINYFSITFLP